MKSIPLVASVSPAKKRPTPLTGGQSTAPTFFRYSRSKKGHEMNREKVVNLLSMRMLVSLDFDESFTHAVEDIEQELIVLISEDEVAEAAMRAHSEYKNPTPIHYIDIYPDGFK